MVDNFNKIMRFYNKYVDKIVKKEEKPKNYTPVPKNKTPVNYTPVPKKEESSAVKQEVSKTEVNYTPMPKEEVERIRRKRRHRRANNILISSNKSAPEQKKSKVVGWDIVKWGYAKPETLAQQGVLGVAVLGHNLNKAITAGEDIIGVDVPFIGNARGEEAKRVDAILKQKGERLDKKADKEARQTLSMEGDVIERGKRLMDSSLGVLGGGVVAGELLSGIKLGAVAEGYLHGALGGGVSMSVLEDSNRVLSNDKYMPLENKKLVLRDFAAGAISGVVGVSSHLAAAKKLKIIEGVSKGKNAIKRVVGSVGSGFTMGATYSGAKDVIEGKTPNVKNMVSEGLMFGAFGGVLEGGALVYENRLIPKIEEANIRLKDVHNEKTITYKGKGVGWLNIDVPLVGVQNGKIAIGKPKIEVKRGVWEADNPITPLESKVMDGVIRDYAKRLKNKDFTDEEMNTIQKKYKGLEGGDWEAYVSGLREDMGKVYNVNEKPALSLKEALESNKILSEDGQKAVIRVLDKYDSAYVYGSVGQKTYMGESMTRGSKDIDIFALGDSATTISEALKDELSKVYGKEKVRFAPDSNTKIEVKHKGRWEKVAEVHGLGSYGEGKILSNEYAGFGYRIKEPKITKDGFLVIDFGEQGVRKMSSSLGIRGNRIGPEWYRMKDINDVWEIGDYLKNKGYDLKGIERAKKAIGAEGEEKGFLIFKRFEPYKYRWKSYIPYGYVVKSGYRIKGYSGERKGYYRREGYYWDKGYSPFRGYSMKKSYGYSPFRNYRGGGQFIVPYGGGGYSSKKKYKDGGGLLMKRGGPFMFEKKKEGIGIRKMMKKQLVISKRDLRKEIIRLARFKNI